MKAPDAFDINASNALRYLVAAMDLEARQECAGYDKTTTSEDVLRTENELDSFCDEHYSNNSTMFNKVQDVAIGMAVAYERRGREEGLKMGMGLILNAFPCLPDAQK